MASKEEIRRYQSRYESGNLPWDIGRVDKNLKNILDSIATTHNKVLEIGCGTGDNAIFMARKGLIVTATEIAPLALELAKAKAKDHNVNITFLLTDIIEHDIPGRPFDLVFDRGCFHHYDTSTSRIRFVHRIHEHLGEEGLWLSLIGNADEQTAGNGPPRLSATDIVTAVEPFFEILLLKSSHFDSNRHPPPRCWLFIGKKRKGPTQTAPLKSKKTLN